MASATISQTAAIRITKPDILSGMTTPEERIDEQRSIKGMRNGLSGYLGCISTAGGDGHDRRSAASDRPRPENGLITQTPLRTNPSANRNSVAYPSAYVDAVNQDVGVERESVNAHAGRRGQGDPSEATSPRARPPGNARAPLAAFQSARARWKSGSTEPPAYRYG